jgi:hypothetical protein
MLVAAISTLGFVPVPLVAIGAVPMAVPIATAVVAVVAPDAVAVAIPLSARK